MPKFNNDPQMDKIEIDMREALDESYTRITYTKDDITVQTPTDVGIMPDKGKAVIHRVLELDRLPFITARKKDFAYRYASEYRTNLAWAKMFGVTPVTIHNWLADPGVASYIARTRFDMQSYNIAMNTVLQRQLAKTIMDVLTMKLTADTVGPVTTMVKFVEEKLNHPEKVGNSYTDIYDTKALNQSIDININAPPTPASNPSYYIEDKKVTSVEIAKLKDSLEELDLLADGYDIGSPNNA